MGEVPGVRVEWVRVGGRKVGVSGMVRNGGVRLGCRGGEGGGFTLRRGGRWR